MLSRGAEPPIVSAMIEFALKRDAKPSALAWDITLNRGLLRFLEAALSLPDRQDGGALDHLHLHLATEPSALQVHLEHLGPDATAERRG
jgi:hypothetical protein